MAWSAEQRRNANVIANVGRSLGASRRDIQIALMAAIVESGLRNLRYGDRDSVGLFQQRDAWGSFAQRTDPASAARMFFLGGHGGQRGLFDFKNRGNMSPGQAAQSVQVSAFPGRYDQHRAEAASLLGMADDGGSQNYTYTRTTLGDVPGLDAMTQDLERKRVEQSYRQINNLGELENPLGELTFDSASGLDSAASDEAEDALGGVDFDNAEPFKFGHPEDPMLDLHLPGAEEMFGGPMGSPGGGGDLGKLTGSAPDQYGGTQYFYENLPGGGGNGVGVPSGTGWRAKVVQAARKMLGTPYVWGGTSYSGVDCSGLIKLIYGKYGIDMPRISADQARSGSRVPISQLEPGDLVAWDNSSRNNGADHIAIYAGDGKIIEAPRPGGHVQVNDIGSGAWGVKLGAPGGGSVSFDMQGTNTKQVGPGGGRWGVHYNVAAAGNEMAKKFGVSNVGGFNDRNIGGTSKKSDHAFGLALDFMGGKQNLADYAVSNAQRLGVDYVIYNRHIWSAARADEGWRPYNGASPHTDHVHVSFLGEGASWTPPSERAGSPSRSGHPRPMPSASPGSSFAYRAIIPPPTSSRRPSGYSPSSGVARPDYNAPVRRSKPRRTGSSSSSHYVAPKSFKRPTRPSAPPPKRKPKRRRGGASGGGSSSGKRPV